MARTTSISEARARLPELARSVASTPGRVEYISHRDLEEDIAMTTRSHLRYLEDSLRELRARNAGAFRLGGSIASDLTDADVETGIEALKSEAAAAADAKGDRLPG